MRKKHRIISFAVIFIFVFMQLAVASAEYSEKNYSQISQQEDVFGYLTLLGIIDEQDVSEFNDDDAVTKGEAADLIVKSLGRYSSAKSLGFYNGFSDLRAGDKYADIVSYAVGVGILSGTIDGTLELDTEITYEQATKMFVSGMGYDFRAQIAGGYPNGYIVTASEIKLFDGINISMGSRISKWTFAKMLYNAFSIPVLKDIAISPTDSKITFQSDSEATLEREYLEGNDLVLNTGIVEVTKRTTIAANEVLNDDEIIISSHKMRTDLTNTDEFIGYEVEYVAEQKPNTAIGTLLRFRPTKDNLIVNLTKDNTPVYRSDRIEYMDLNTNKIRQYKLNSNVVYLYNNRRLTTLPQNGFKFADGNVKLIYSIREGSVKVVRWSESKSFIVNTINELNELIYLDNATFSGSASVDMREKDDRITVVRNIDGDYVDWRTIEPKSAISIIQSSDKYYLEIIVLPDPILGRLSEISEGQWVVIDETTYNVTSQLGAVEIGKAGKFYTNEIGDIFKFESSAYDYVYLIDKNDNKDEGIASGFKIKVYDNFSGIHVYQAAKKININGVSYSSETAAFNAVPLQTVVSLVVGSDGLVREIISAEKYGGQRDRKYCRYARAFNEGEVRDSSGILTGETDVPFKFDDETLFFVVPQNMNDDDFGAVPDYKDGVRYNTQAYECDPDTDFVKAIVVTIDVDSLINSTLSETSDVGIVTRITQGLDKDEQRTYFVEGFSEGKSFRYTAANRGDVINVVSGLSNGDVIRFNKSYSDEILNVERLVSLSREDTFYHVDRDGLNERFYGPVMMLRKAAITDLSKYLRHELEVNPDGSYTDMSTIRIYADVRNTENENYEFSDYYIYDKTAEKVTIATIDDVIPYNKSTNNPSIVYIAGSRSIAKILVIVK